MHMELFTWPSLPGKGQRGDADDAKQSQRMGSSPGLLFAFEHQGL